MTQPIHPMLERVARAMAGTCWEPFDPKVHGSPANQLMAQKLWLEKARAAIQALMEPDERMREVWTKHLWLSDRDFEISWQAMLRPLIGEGE